MFELFNQETMSDLSYLLLGLIWLIFIFIYHLSAEFSLVNSGTAFGSAYFVNLFFKNDLLVEKMTSWFFVFFVIFIIQKLFENNESDKKG